MSLKKESVPFIISQKDLDEAGPSNSAEVNAEPQMEQLEPQIEQREPQMGQRENNESIAAFYGISLHDEKLFFEEFCDKVGFPIPIDYERHLNTFDSNNDFIVDEEMLTLLGYDGELFKKNEEFKRFLIHMNQNIGDDECVIPFDLKKIGRAIYVEISPLNFLRALMKMQSEESADFRTFLCDLMVIKRRYFQYLLEKTNSDYEAYLERTEEQISNLNRMCRHRNLIILEREREIASINRENDNELLQKDIELLQKMNRILALEKKIEELLPNTVVPPEEIEKRQQFCLIDSGDNRNGRVFKRQSCSFEGATQDYLSSGENRVILLKVSYFPNAIYFFNNVRHFAKTELKEKILIVGSKVEVIAPDYNLNMFVRDIVAKFRDELENQEYSVYENEAA